MWVKVAVANMPLANVTLSLLVVHQYKSVSEPLAAVNMNLVLVNPTCKLVPNLIMELGRVVAANMLHAN